MGGMNLKRQTAMKGIMNPAQTFVSTEILAGTIFSVVQYLALQRYMLLHNTFCNYIVKYNMNKEPLCLLCYLSQFKEVVCCLSVQHCLKVMDLK
jgi:hypothetical protein